MKRITQIVAVLICVLVLLPTAKAIVPIPPGTISDMTGAWLGPSDYGDYARIELSPNGTGLLAFTGGDKVYLYKIVRTRLQYLTVSFELEPISGAEPAVLTGTTTFRNMVLELSPADGEWRRQLFLVEQQHLNELTSVVNTTIRQYGQEPRHER